MIAHSSIRLDLETIDVIRTTTIAVQTELGDYNRQHVTQSRLIRAALELLGQDPAVRSRLADAVYELMQRDGLCIPARS